MQVSRKIACYNFISKNYNARLEQFENMSSHLGTFGHVWACFVTKRRDLVILPHYFHWCLGMFRVYFCLLFSFNKITFSIGICHFLFLLSNKFFIAHGRGASLMQRRCLRFFAAIRLRHCCFNSAIGGTEPQEAPNA